MPDWLIERGIGETRFARIEDDRIVEARILVDGIVPAGTRLTGKLKRSGVQLFAVADGQDYLLPDGAHGITEGRSLTIRGLPASLRSLAIVYGVDNLLE